METVFLSRPRFAGSNFSLKVLLTAESLSTMIRKKRGKPHMGKNIPAVPAFFCDMRLTVSVSISVIDIES